MYKMNHRYILCSVGKDQNSYAMDCGCSPMEASPMLDSSSSPFSMEKTGQPNNRQKRCYDTKRGYRDTCSTPVHPAMYPY